MTAIGGALETLAINGREFAGTGDSDVSIKLGGFENENQPNGNGTSRQIKTPVNWMAGGLAIECDDENQDLEFIQSIQEGAAYVDVVITMASGTSWQGSGQIEGELAKSQQSASVTFDMQGPGKLKQL
jgi:hypothetical protein